MKGLEIINKRLIYFPQPGDTPEHIALVESEVKAFNDARAGSDSKELGELKRMSEHITALAEKRSGDNSVEELWYIGRVLPSGPQYVTEDNTVTYQRQWGVSYPTKEAAAERLARGIMYDGMELTNLYVMQFLITTTIT